MKKDSRIYIAGHTGFIGSAVISRLKKAGYNNLIFRTRRELDLTNQQATARLFNKYRPEYVFLLAAKVGGIKANDESAADFFYQNIILQTNVIHAAYKYKVNKLLFLGSSCMYPKFSPQPMKPGYLMTGPLEPTNEPFALAKICGVKMCQAYNKQYKTRFICAVPAAVYGPGDHFDERGHVVAGLIRRAYLAVLNPFNKLTVWGSGRAKREFLFIDDAADACIFLMRKYDGDEVINIGARKEVSIKELAEKIKDISGYQGEIVFQRDKPDGNPRRLLDSSLIFSFKWRPKISLEEGLKRTYGWYSASSIGKDKV